MTEIELPPAIRRGYKNRSKLKPMTTEPKRLTPGELAEIDIYLEGMLTVQAISPPGIHAAIKLRSHIAALSQTGGDCEALCAAVLDGTVEDEMRYATVNLGNVIEIIRVHFSTRNPWPFDCKAVFPPAYEGDPNSKCSIEVEVLVNVPGKGEYCERGYSRCGWWHGIDGELIQGQPVRWRHIPKEADHAQN